MVALKSTISTRRRGRFQEHPPGCVASCAQHGGVSLETIGARKPLRCLPIFRSKPGAPTRLCRILRTTWVGAPETKVRGPWRSHKPGRVRLAVVRSEKYVKPVRDDPSLDRAKVRFPKNRTVTSDRFFGRNREHPPGCVASSAQHGWVLRKRKSADRSLITSHQQTPNWLRMLIGLERCVSVVTIALGAATVTVYGLTVSSGQQWSRDYNSLQSLQRYERQLRVANEVLKNQMAEQAENPDTGLVPQNPTNTIFIPPASERLSSAISPVPSTTASKLTMPLGY